MKIKNLFNSVLGVFLIFAYSEKTLAIDYPLTPEMIKRGIGLPDVCMSDEGQMTACGSLGNSPLSEFINKILSIPLWVIIVLLFGFVMLFSGLIIVIFRKIKKSQLQKKEIASST